MSDPEIPIENVSSPKQVSDCLYALGVQEEMRDHGDGSRPKENRLFLGEKTSCDATGGTPLSKPGEWKVMGPSFQAFRSLLRKAPDFAPSVQSVARAAISG
jgi:hypothetical protein